MSSSGAYCFFLILLSISIISNLVWIRGHRGHSSCFSAMQVPRTSPRMLKNQGYRAETSSVFMQVASGRIYETTNIGSCAQSWNVPSLPTSLGQSRLGKGVSGPSKGLGGLVRDLMSFCPLAGWAQDLMKFVWDFLRYRLRSYKISPKIMKDLAACFFRCWVSNQWSWIA